MFKEVFILIFFVQNALACIPAGTIREIALHRIENVIDDTDISRFVTIKSTTRSDKRAIFPLAEETEEKSESTTKSSTISTTSSASSVSSSTSISNGVEQNTTTFKPDTIDDPNFVPGGFLDPYGNPKVIPPPPVTTVFQDFLKKTQDRKKSFLWTGANVIITLACQILNIVTFTGLCCLIVPLFTFTKGMNRNLPPTKRDKLKIAKRIAIKKLKKPKNFVPTKKSGNAEKKLKSRRKTKTK